MKKVIIFCTVIALLFIMLVSCEPKIVEEESLITFAVASDIHVYANSKFTADDIDHYSNVDKTIHLSEPIFASVADDIIEKKYSFVLLTGDLTEYGDEESHRATIEILKKIEDAGTDVYVINGNHDVMSNNNRKSFSVSQSRFSELYSEFGYNEADSVLPGTLSYSLVIKDKFRLIALDNIAYYTDADKTEMTEELSDEKLDWVTDQILRSEQEGTVPILIAHIGLLSHWPKIATAIDVGANSDNTYFYLSVAETGERIGFVGHSHLNDIKCYSAGENVYNEIMTGSTCFLQANYRSVSYSGNEFSVKTNTLTKIDPKYISPLVSDDIKNAVENDFPGYQKEHFSVSIKDTVKRKFNGIFNKINLGCDDFQNYLSNKLIPTIFNLPLYASDDNTSVSMQEILARYDISLPSSEYKVLSDIIPTIVGSLVKGDENLRDSVELKIAKYAVYSAVYLLSEHSDEIKTFQDEDIDINIDLNKLFKEGVLECYDSKLMPMLINIINKSNNTKIKVVFRFIQNSFKSIERLSDVIEEMSGGLIDDMDNYFVGKEIKFDELIEKGIFDNYLSDLLTDEKPSDREITITAQ